MFRKLCVCVCVIRLKYTSEISLCFYCCKMYFVNVMVYVIWMQKTPVLMDKYGIVLYQQHMRLYFDLSECVCILVVLTSTGIADSVDIVGTFCWSS